LILPPSEEHFSKTLEKTANGQTVLWKESLVSSEQKSITGGRKLTKGQSLTLNFKRRRVLIPNGKINRFQSNIKRKIFNYHRSAKATSAD
jgi:hypothetical protein